MSDRPIYLDYNATTPVDPAVAEAMLPFLREHFGNPSSSHPYGAVARAAVEKARRQVAVLLGARPEEIVFTSGGSEANNAVLLGVARALRARGRHVVTTAIEHPAVLEPCAVLGAEGHRVTRVPVDGEGRVDPAALAAALNRGATRPASLRPRRSLFSSTCGCCGRGSSRAGSRRRRGGGSVDELDRSWVYAALKSAAGLGPLLASCTTSPVLSRSSAVDEKK